MALFQPSSSVSYGRNKIETKKYLEIKLLKGKEPGFTIEKPIEKPIIFESELANHNIKAQAPSAHSEKITTEKVNKFDFSISSPIHTLDKKPEKKKKGWSNRFRKISSNIFIGLIFLGIAIVLAILNLGTLSVVFAIVSAIFLILGLRKVFRKQRFKNIFR